MSEETKNSKKCNNLGSNNSASLIWFLGFLGAAVYYIQNANSFMDGIVGLLK